MKKYQRRQLLWGVALCSAGAAVMASATATAQETAPNVYVNLGTTF
jgi:hypothetical protein